LIEIAGVLPGSIADGLGLQAGDHVISINDRDVEDIIDYRFLVSDENITIKVRRSNRGTETLSITKDPDDNLGIECSPLRMKRCKNRCIFCFVDQMPYGCRKTLYLKDEDYRASFLYGSYITLGALSESEWERIFRLRLTPLYISVHTTDPTLRALMLGNKKAPDIMESMRRLAAAGISMHTQIVLCPGINDGPHLLNTLENLASLFPAVASIAVVPVGLTSFRKGLFPLRAFTRQDARVVLKTIVPIGARFKKQLGTRLVFPSDELYIKAGEPIPPASFYEDFPQIENGVGMAADFLREAARTKLPARMNPCKITVVSGVSFSKILAKVLDRVQLVKGLRVKQITVPNRFFGPSVTVTGLLTGGDILHALSGKRLGDLLLVPANALKEGEDVFLDNMTLDQVAQRLSIPVLKVEGFRHMIRLLRSGGNDRP
jgi:putative radical SAM enzyme (TIGR03279 family)